jgi:hypothetical protein
MTMVINTDHAAVDAADPRPVCNCTPGRVQDGELTEALKYGKRP